MYGGSTPAGGVFATTTSVAMLVMLTPFAVIASNIHSYSSLQDLLRKVSRHLRPSAFRFIADLNILEAGVLTKVYLYV